MKYKFLLYLFILFLFILFLFINKNIESFNLKSNDFNDNICCIYSYYEKNELYKNNLKYFLDNGLLDNVDYYIIINGDCSIELEKIKDMENITILYRENKGFDFGSYCYVLNNIIKKEYEYYFFINTSVRGPYLKNKSDKWTDLFIDLFYDDKIKVVGTTINIHNPSSFEKDNLQKIYGNKDVFSHVQSMFFCIKHDYLVFLKNNNFFDCQQINQQNMKYIISFKEIGISQNALNNGWNINCIISKYRGLDYLTINENINNTSLEGDPYYKNAYFSETIDPYEVIFFKNSRFDIDK